MLYVFHGTDVVKSVEKANSLVNSLRAKKPDAAFVRMGEREWSVAVIEEHLGGQGLFSNKYIVFLDRVTENAEAKEKLPDMIEAIGDSTNIFIVAESKLNADLKRAIESHAAKIVVSDERQLAGGSANKDFNIFALADAVGSREALKAWAIYREALKRGLESESILGTLFWQAKSMALASAATSAGEAGLSPFVYSKSKRYAANYSKEELNRLLTDLITIYHDGHRGLGDMELAIERRLLAIC